MTGAIAALAALKGGDTINLADMLLAATVYATYTLESDGDIVKNEDSTIVDMGDWITPKSRMTDYEVRATIVSGSVEGGVTGSWLDFSTDRFWTKSDPGTVEMTIEIRDAATSTVRDSATITIVVGV